MVVLANRHILTSGQCLVCQIHTEDVAHALFMCSRAKEVWRVLGLIETIEQTCTPHRSGPEILEYLRCNAANRKQYLDVVQIPKMIAATSWYLWWQRRQIVKKEEVQAPVRTGPAIRALALNYVRANGKPATMPRMNRWWKPLSGQLSLNVDASFTEESYSGSCGAVIRDHLGSFVAASTAKLEYAADIVAAEAAALVEGLKLALQLGIDSLLIQMDNLIVVESLKSNSGHSMVVAPILDECRNLMEDFGKVEVEHCNRESNTVAHCISSEGTCGTSVFVDGHTP